MVVAGALFTQVQPTQAAVIAEGDVRNGYYWQFVEGSNGTRYIGRSSSSSKFQKHAKCNEAGAKSRFALILALALTGFLGTPVHGNDRSSTAGYQSLG